MNKHISLECLMDRNELDLLDPFSRAEIFGSLLTEKNCGRTVVFYICKPLIFFTTCLQYTIPIEINELTVNLL